MLCADLLTKLRHPCASCPGLGFKFQASGVRRQKIERVRSRKQSLVRTSAIAAFRVRSASLNSMRVDGTSAQCKKSTFSAFGVTFYAIVCGVLVVKCRASSSIFQFSAGARFRVLALVSSSRRQTWHLTFGNKHMELGTRRMAPRPGPMRQDLFGMFLRTNLQRFCDAVLALPNLQ